MTIIDLYLESVKNAGADSTDVVTIGCVDYSRRFSIATEGFRLFSFEVSSEDEAAEEAVYAIITAREGTVNLRFVSPYGRKTVSFTDTVEVYDTILTDFRKDLRLEEASDEWVISYVSDLATVVLFMVNELNGDIELP